MVSNSTRRVLVLSCLDFQQEPHQRVYHIIDALARCAAEVVMVYRAYPHRQVSWRDCGRWFWPETTVTEPGKGPYLRVRNTAYQQFTSRSAASRGNNG